MAVNEWVIRNTQGRPDSSGVVRPYLTRTFNGLSLPVVVTDTEVDALASMGEPVPVPDGLITAPLRAHDTHDLLKDLLAAQRVTNRRLAQIAGYLAPVPERPVSRPLTRWQRFKFRLHRLVRRA